MINIFSNLKNKKEGGYTLLFAVVISTLVLSVGLTILTISKKESLLASSAQESVYAVYAADSGVECAVYVMNSSEVFSTSTYGSFPQTNIDVPCQESTGATLNQNGDVYTFEFDYNIDDKSCAIVSIERKYVEDTDLGMDVLATSIASRGYNIGWNSGSGRCDASSPRKVERAFLYSIR